MRATVLCILAFAGATCALQLPSIPSPQSALDKGSSILGNIPGIRNGDDSSSSSSSSEEDQKTVDKSNELAERLVDDIVNAAGGFGSIALLPLDIGSAIFNSVTKEIRNFVSDVLPPETLEKDGQNILKLSSELARTILQDAGKLAKDIGGLLLEPEKMKLRLIHTVAREVQKFVKNVQNQMPGDSSAQHRPRPDDRPHHQPQPNNPQHRPSSPRPPKPTHPGRPSTRPPRPTHPGHPSTRPPKPTHPGRPSTHPPKPTHPGRPSTTHAPKPTSSGRPSSTHPPKPTSSDRPSSEQPRPTRPEGPSTERPRPTRPEGSVSKDSNVLVRPARNIDFSFSTGISVDQVLSDGKVRNLGTALASVDFSAIVKPIPKISDLTPLNKLPSLPGLASATSRARDLVIQAIAAGASTIEEAIQLALTAAVHSVKPAEAIVNLVNIILQIYVFMAQSALGIPPVATALMKEAAIVAGSIVSSLLAVMSEGVADGVRALLN